MLPLILLSDSHVFEPPDLWQTRIDAAFPRSCEIRRNQPLPNTRLNGRLEPRFGHYQL